jgi:hypothetical protein
MKINKPVKAKPIVTHEGGIASRTTHEETLRRTVMSCMLWEKEFYEDGVSIADRIKSLIPKVPAANVQHIAIYAREVAKLRHVPLLIVREMARIPTHKHLVSSTLERVIQRADELSEFLAIYWKDGKCPVSAQVRKGLGNALKKFSEYDLAKYNRDGAVRLRDVMFLARPKPENEAQAALWKKLADDTLATPDTWEVELSASSDKKASWTRLLSEKKLGSLALLRNLRNMTDVGIDRDLIKEAILTTNHSRTLPFRFIAAARFAPPFEPQLETAMVNNLKTNERLSGRTLVLVDVSGSMDSGLSTKSDMTRLDAACGVAMVTREICEDAVVFSFSNREVEVPARRGFALRDAIIKSQSHGGTALAASLAGINAKVSYDRIIIITDEQSRDGSLAPKCDKAYIINVASAQNGVGYNKYVHINGFSEAVVNFIIQYEKSAGLATSEG